MISFLQPEPMVTETELYHDLVAILRELEVLKAEYARVCALLAQQ